MPATAYFAAQAAGAKYLGQVQPADWSAYLGAFLPAALLGLAVIAYLVRKLDASQTENKELSERLISNQEVMAPLLKDAIELIGQQGELIAEQGDLIRDAKAEAKIAREERERRDSR